MYENGGVVKNVLLIKTTFGSITENFYPLLLNRFIYLIFFSGNPYIFLHNYLSLVKNQLPNLLGIDFKVTEGKGGGGPITLLFGFIFVC